MLTGLLMLQSEFHFHFLSLMTSSFVTKNLQLWLMQLEPPYTRQHVKLLSLTMLNYNWDWIQHWASSWLALLSLLLLTHFKETSKNKKHLMKVWTLKTFAECKDLFRLRTITITVNLKDLITVIFCCSASLYNKQRHTYLKKSPLGVILLQFTARQSMVRFPKLRWYMQALMFYCKCHVMMMDAGFVVLYGWRYECPNYSIKGFHSNQAGAYQAWFISLKVYN